MPIDALPAREAVMAEEIRRIVKRSHGLRSLGLVLGGVAVGTVLFQLGTSALVWGLLGFYVLVWPHVVWLVVRRCARPVAADERWLLVDAAMIGVWIALMQFNLLPSLLLAVMFAMALVAIGGVLLLLRGVAVQVLACGVTAAVSGMAFAPTTRMLDLMGSIPLLIIFPMALGIVMHGLAQRVRRQNRILLEMSSIDSLSGLFNRRHWQSVVDAVLAGSHCDKAVMLLLDIDHFKQVNDQFGHTVGDEVILMIGSIIRDSVREGDLAGRYGGDEFGVVLREANVHVAGRVAERIRSLAACMRIEGAPGLRCTLSIGIAPIDPAICDAKGWVKAADVALYRAKLAGRNRFVVAA